jgi:hypothetical protein
MNHKKLLLLCLLAFISFAASATHIRGGYIAYEHLGGHSYVIIVNLYTTDINVIPDSDTIIVDFGDGQVGAAVRVNGNGMPGGNDTKHSIFTVNHTFDQEGDYLVSVTDPNRTAGINNINNRQNTDQIPFYTESLIRIADGVGFCTNDMNPLGLAPWLYGDTGSPLRQGLLTGIMDVDSLSFELVSPLQAAGTPVPGYIFPDQYPPTGINNVMTIDPQSGLLSWDSPMATGLYSIAVRIKEWKNGSMYGFIQMDLSIFIADLASAPAFTGTSSWTQSTPGTYIFNVDQGDTLDLAVLFADNLADSTSLSLFGEPLALGRVDASYTNAITATSDSGHIIWVIDSADSRAYSYTITFRGTSYSHSGLSKIDLSHDIIALVNVSGPYTNDCLPLLPFTGIEEMKGYNELISYPNPANETVYIPLPKDGDTKDISITLYTLTGQTHPAKYTIEDGKLVVERDKLPAGMYFFSLTNKDGIVGNGKIVFQ